MFRKKLPENPLKEYFFIIIATIIWAAAGPVIKYTLDYIPPLTFLFLRFLIASLVLLPYTIYEVQKVKVDSKDYFKLFLLGIFSQTSLSILFFALKYTSVIDHTLIGIVGCVLLVAAGNYFYKEKIGKDIKIGLLLASIGTLLVFLEPILLGEKGLKVSQRIFANTSLLLYELSWVLYVIWLKMSMGEKSHLLKKTLSFIHLKSMKKEYPPTLLTALSIFVGLFTVAPMAVFEMMGMFGDIQGFNILSIDPKGYTGILYMSLLSSVVAYVLYQNGITKVNVSDSAFFHYLSPILTIPFAYILLGEIPNKFVIMGGIIIGIGIYIAVLKDKKV